MSQIPTNLGSRPNGLQIPLDQRLAEIAYDRTYELEKEQLTVGDEVRIIQRQIAICYISSSAVVCSVKFAEEL